MIAPADETARPPAGPDFGDAVTFAWGDLEAEVFGTARIGVVGGSVANALAFVFSGAELVTMVADGDEAAAGADWSRISAAGLRAEIVTPLEAWRVAGEGFDLSFTAVSPPGELALATSGTEGYEQVCRVEGTAAGRPIACLGQRGHEWGSPAGGSVELVRSVSAWIGDDAAVVAAGARPAKAKSHSEEELAAVLFDPEPGRVDEPRLSTVYDGEGRQRRAGMELWVGEEDDYPRRLAGEAVCGTSVDLEGLRLDVAFFQWRMEGRLGAGRYDVMRRRA